MPGLLAIDAAQLCVEAEHARRAPLPTGTVARLLDGRQVVFRDAPSDARLLHAEAAGLARHDALVRVPGEGPAALLALLTRDRHMLDPARGAGPLGFLGRAVAAALAAEPMTGEGARQAFLEWLGAGASWRPPDGRGLCRGHRGLPRISDPAPWQRARSDALAALRRQICAPGWRTRRPRAPAMPRAPGTCPRCAASSASLRAGMAWTTRR